MGVVILAYAGDRGGRGAASERELKVLIVGR